MRSYRIVLRRRRLTILVVGLASLAAGAVAIRLAPPRFTARSLLAIRQVESVRSSLATQTGYEPSVVAGRYMIHALHKHRQWIVIVEPDVDAKLLVVVTPDEVSE